MKKMIVGERKSVPDIVTEMQSAANRYRIVDSIMLGMFAERLDDAWKRDILVEAKRNQDVVDGLTAECDRLREALKYFANISDEDLDMLEQRGKYMQDHSLYGGGVLESIVCKIRNVRVALSAPQKGKGKA